MTQKAADTVKAPSKNSTFSLNRTKGEPSANFIRLNPVLKLHQNFGNRAVGKMHASGLIQAKLKIGTPGDKYEQEADRVAKEVVSQPGPAVTRQVDEDQEAQTSPLVTKITPLIRRSSLEDEDEVQEKSIRRQEDEEQELQSQPREDEEPVQSQIISRQTAEDEVREKSIRRQEDEEQELQSQPREDEEPVQSQIISRQTDADEIQEKLIRRQEDEEQELQSQPQEDEEPVQSQIISRQTAEDEVREKMIQRQNNQSAGGLSPAAENAIRGIKGSGRPLPNETRSFMESRFGADFNPVRIHTDSRADTLAGSMNAKAFTLGSDIAFKSGHYAPETSAGKTLLAHELTHVVQQKSAIARKSPVHPVMQRTAEPKVQGVWGWIKKKAKKAWKGVKKIGSMVAKGFAYFIQKAKNFIANRVRDIPGYRFMSGLLGKDPISEKKVKPGGGLIKAVFTLLNKKKIYDELVKANIVGKAFKLIRDAFKSANLTASFIVGSIKNILSVISINPQTWKKAAGMFISFLRSLVAKVFKVGWTLLSHVVKWILEKAKEYAFKLLKAIPGFSLIMDLFGNPLGEKKKKKKKKKSFGFVRLIFKLLKKEKTYDNLVKANILGKIAAVFKGAFSKSGLSWGYIKKSVATIWNFLKKNPTSWMKAAGMVVSFIRSLAGKLFRVAGTVILKVPPLILEGFLLLVGAPVKKIMGIINKGRRVILKIAGNPIRFVGNLFKAIKQGFAQFKAKIWEHLKAGLFGWLMGALEGAEIKLPQKWDLKGIIYLVLQILGLTYQRIRKKVVEKLGPRGEQIVSTMEKTVSFLVTLVTKGPMALWERIKAKAGEIKDAAISAIKGWIVTKIVTAAITKLATMFNPVGAIIQAALAIYNTIMFFIEKAKQIASLVQAVFNSIAQIAYGQIKSAANWIEKTMARAIPVILGFLARLVGLGGISEKIKNVVTKIRQPVDNVVDTVIDWIVKKGKSLFGKGKALVKKGVSKIGSWWKSKKKFKHAGQDHTLYFQGQSKGARLMMRSTPQPYSGFINAAEADTPEKKTAKQNAQNLSRKIDAAVAKSSGKEGEQLNTNITDMINQLAVETTKFMPAGSGSGTIRPVYNPVTGAGFGRGIRVNPLVKNDQGSGVNQGYVNQNDTFRKLKARRKGGASYYVAGHLLNNNLGGPGDNWKNLTPLTQYANTQDHEPNFESAVKNAVNKDGKSVDFVVSAVYGSHSGLKSDKIQDLKNSGEEEKADVIQAEARVPTELDCSAIEVSPKKGVLIKQHRVKNKIDTGLDTYDLQGVPDQKVYISEMVQQGKSALKALNGVGEKRAEAIIAAWGSSGFRTWSKLASAVPGLNISAMQKTAGKKVLLYKVA